MGDVLVRLLGARMLGSFLAWGTLAGVLALVAGIVLAVVLARTRALRVTFRGARIARGVVYGWTVLVCALGAGALGGLHGAVRGFREVVRDASFTRTTLHPAAGPVADGLIYAVAVETASDAGPMLAGSTPVPVAPLRTVLTDTTGAAVLAGLRRVPALQQSAAGRSGSLLLSGLANLVAQGKADEALESVGLRVALDELAAALPAAPGVTRAALVVLVERSFLPAVVSAGVGLGERHMLIAGLVWLLAALLAPIAMLWLIEGVVRLVRARRPGSPS